MYGPISVKETIENTHMYDYFYIDNFWEDMQETINSGCLWADRIDFYFSH